MFKKCYFVSGTSQLKNVELSRNLQSLVQNMPCPDHDYLIVLLKAQIYINNQRAITLKENTHFNITVCLVRGHPSFHLSHHMHEQQQVAKEDIQKLNQTIWYIYAEKFVHIQGVYSFEC